ncbi:MAG TPA: TetR/AcrR family transcriptional regulator [Flavobacterium sp.]|nr:TetR/AcrR family transcriptional regulator [Flavobacterium sp.]
MKDKIVSRATDMFLKLGFKSITMDDIASDMCISKKTIYKFFTNKEQLIVEAANLVHRTVYDAIDQTMKSGFNPVEENFEVRKTFKAIFQAVEKSPLYQLKKHYPEIYHEVVHRERDFCHSFMRENIKKGIVDGYYRPDTDVESAVEFYYTIVFHINETNVYERDAYDKELAALIYHTRAIATDKGVAELERQLAVHPEGNPSNETQI